MVRGTAAWLLTTRTGSRTRLNYAETWIVPASAETFTLLSAAPEPEETHVLDVFVKVDHLHEAPRFARGRSGHLSDSPAAAGMEMSSGRRREEEAEAGEAAGAAAAAGNDAATAAQRAHIERFLSSVQVDAKTGRKSFDSITFDSETNLDASILLEPEKVVYFRQYLEEERHALNAELLFLMETGRWRAESARDGARLSPTNALRASFIFARFFSGRPEFAETCLSLPPPELRERVARAFQHSSRVSADVFEEARAFILVHFEREHFPRFLRSMFFLSMYSAMVGSAERYSLPESVWAMFASNVGGGEEDGWVFVAQKKGVLVHTKRFEGEPCTCIRGSGVVPLSVREMGVLANDLALRKHWDPLLREARLVEALDAHSCVFQVAYRLPSATRVLGALFPASDFVCVRTQREDPADGSLSILARSVVHPDAPVRKSGYRRGEMIVGGWQIRPHGEERCVVVYMNQAHLLNAPEWSERLLVTKRAMVVWRISKYVQRERAQARKEGRPVAWLRES